MSERTLHCWADGPSREVCDLPLNHPQWWAGLRVIGSTCMLPAGHGGEHEWTPDDTLVIEFLDAEGQENLKCEEGE